MEIKECGCGLCTEFVKQVARCSIPCTWSHNKCREWAARQASGSNLCGCYGCEEDYTEWQDPKCKSPCSISTHKTCVEWTADQVKKTSTTGSRAAALLRRIADTLEQKAAYYGDSISKAPILVPGMPIETAALVRASDKIARIQHGSGDTTDAWVDLIGYAALVLAMRNAEVD